MSNELQDKTIKIQGKSFRVIRHEIDGDKEYITLSREIIPTISDIGYNSIDDILIDKNTLSDILDFIEKNIGQIIEIGRLNKNGEIKIETVKILGSSLAHPDKINIEVDGQIQKLHYMYIVKSIYLSDLIKQSPKKVENLAEEIFEKMVSMNKTEFHKWVDQNF